jgi:hypothetical protein
VAQKAVPSARVKHPHDPGGPLPQKANSSRQTSLPAPQVWVAQVQISPSKHSVAVIHVSSARQHPAPLQIPSPAGQLQKSLEVAQKQ